MTETYNCHNRHALRLTSSDTKYMCDGCLMDGHGERYRCSSESCDYDLHKDCVDPKPTRTMDAFPGSTFDFHHTHPSSSGSKSCCRTTYCDVCGETVRGFVYHCKKTGFDVHPQCANLERVLRVEGVRFDLRKGEPSSRCNWCKRKARKGAVRDIPGFCYESDEDCSFHVSCLMKIGIQFGSTSSSRSSVGGGGCSRCASSENEDDRIHRIGRELVVPERRLQKKINKKPSDRITKIGRVVGLFLKIVLSVIFGDPTMIITSLVVHLLSS